MKITEDMYGPWRSGYEKPPCAGVYERQNVWLDITMLSHFNGTDWVASNPELEERLSRHGLKVRQDLPWRELNDDYSQQAKK